MNMAKTQNVTFSRDVKKNHKKSDQVYLANSSVALVKHGTHHKPL